MSHDHTYTIILRYCLENVKVTLTPASVHSLTASLTPGRQGSYSWTYTLAYNEVNTWPKFKFFLLQARPKSTFYAIDYQK